MKMTTKQIVDICNNSYCDNCEINQTYCDAYRYKFHVSTPAGNNKRKIRENLGLPDSSYSKSEVIEL